MHPPAVPSPINFSPNDPQPSAAGLDGSQYFQQSERNMLLPPSSSSATTMFRFPANFGRHPASVPLTCDLAAHFATTKDDLCANLTPFSSKPNCHDLLAHMNSPFLLRTANPSGHPFVRPVHPGPMMVGPQRPLMNVPFHGVQCLPNSNGFIRNEVDAPNVAKFTIDSILSLTSAAGGVSSGGHQTRGPLCFRRFGNSISSGKSNTRPNAGVRAPKGHQQGRVRMRNRKQSHGAIVHNPSGKGDFSNLLDEAGPGTEVPFSVSRDPANLDSENRDISSNMEGDSPTVVRMNDSLDNVTSNCAGSGSINSGNKRVRTIFTPDQLEKLEEEFHRQQYMVGPERLFLAASLKLTEAQVKVWFQNRRIKWRKQQLELQQMKVASWREQEDGFLDSDD